MAGLGFLLGATLLMGVSRLGAASPPSEAPPVMAPVFAAGDRGYSVRLWEVEDGLPVNFLRSLVQTPDGYLWWPNDWGLSRFDGVRLRTFPLGEEPDGPSFLSLVFCDSTGRLWVAGDTALGTLRDGRLSWVRTLRSPAGSEALFADDAGGGWLAQRLDVETRIFCLASNQLSVVREYRVPLPAYSLAVDGQQRIWLTGPPGLFEVLEPGEDGRSAVRPVPIDEPRISHLFRRRDGSIAIAGAGGVHVLRDGEWSRVHSFSAPIPEANQLRQAGQDGLGNYWIGTRTSGLWVSLADGWTGRVDLPGLLVGEGFGIGAVLCDRENGVWIGTRHGVYQLQRVAFRRELKSAVLQGTEAVDLGFDERGGVWVLTESGKAYHFPEVGSTSAELVGAGDIRFLEVGGDGAVWLAGTDRVQTLRDDTPRETMLFQEAGLETSGVWSLAVAGDSAWIGTLDAGLWKVSHGRLTREDLAGAAGESQAVLVAANAGGQVRALVDEGGLWARVGDGWERATGSGWASRQRLAGLHVDPEGRTWAYGGRPALVRQAGGVWAEVPLRLNEVPVEVIAAASDDQGGLWALTKAHGVVRIERSFDEPSAPEPKWFGVEDGLPSLAGRGWGKGVTMSADGRMWFTTALGVTVISPGEWRAAREASRPPQVHLEEVRLDGMSLDWRRAGGLTLPSGRNRLEIAFTAIGLNNARQNQFRYRLEGLDEVWTEAQVARSAIFRRLPPGEYLFRVMASNSDGVWNEQGASLAFTVLPAWWQSRGFRFGLAGLVLAAFWGGRFLKLRQMARESARREEFTRRLIQSQEAERKRLAGELHDGLGQNLLIAKNQLFLAEEAEGDAAIKPRVRKAADSVSAALEEARTISHQLRPFQLERLGVTKAIRSLVREFADSTRMPLDARIAEVDGLLSADAEVMVYRVLQEGLNNVVRHSDASEVRVVVERLPGAIRMTVQDDGRGFDVARMRSAGGSPRGLGLTGFEERTRLVGGRFRCESAPGQGTTLVFDIPVPMPRGCDGPRR